MVAGHGRRSYVVAGHGGRLHVVAGPRLPSLHLTQSREYD